MDQSQEFVASHRAVPELTAKRAGDRPRVLLLDASHHHAKVLCLDDHANTSGLEHFLDRARDLFSEALLYLKAPREDLHESRQLRQSDNPSVRDVGDVRLTEKRKHVMLAE